MLRDQRGKEGMRIYFSGKRLVRSEKSINSNNVIYKCKKKDRRNQERDGGSVD